VVPTFTHETYVPVNSEYALRNMVKVFWCENFCLNGTMAQDAQPSQSLQMHTSLQLFPTGLENITLKIHTSLRMRLWVSIQVLYSGGVEGAWPSDDTMDLKYITMLYKNVINVPVSNLYSGIISVRFISLFDI
jgi:hypothetical protein